MRLRVRQRNLVVWRGSAGLAGGYSATGLTRAAPTGRIRRCLRIGALLTVIGLMRLARGIRARWKPLLAGGVLTAAGLMLSSSMWSLASVFGLWLLVYALLIPVNPDGGGRRAELERELAAYSTPAQRRDLEAILDRYPDGATYELRDILARQAMAVGHNGVPGAGRC